MKCSVKTWYYTRNMSCSISFSSTFHVISRKFEIQGPLMGTYPQSHHEASVVLGTRHFLASRQQHRGNITELQWREKIWTFFRPWCLNGVATTHMKTMQKSSKIWPEKDVHLVTVVLPRAPFWIFTKRLVSKNMCELIKKVVLQEQCHEIFNT